MSVANHFSVPLYLNHSNNTVPEIMVTMKSKGLQHFLTYHYCPMILIMKSEQN